MDYEFIDIYRHPSESYSRMLDKTVQMQEMPYGYHNAPPPAGHENHEAREQRNSRIKRNK